MEDVTDTLRHKPKIRRLPPHEEVEADVEKLPPRIGVPIRDPDVRLPPEVRAPARVVTEELAAETADDGGIEGIDVIRRRREAHLGVGEVEDEVLALVADVVLLEAEEEGEPVEEVVVGAPLDVGGAAEVSDGFEGGGGGADLGVAEGGVVGEEVVDGDDVVGLVVDCARRRGPSGLRGDGAVAEAHSSMCGGSLGDCDEED